MAELPEDVRAELHESSLKADWETISQVIGRVKPLAPETAKGLQILLDDFRIARIHELMSRVQDDTN